MSDVSIYLDKFSCPADGSHRSSSFRRRCLKGFPECEILLSDMSEGENKLEAGWREPFANSTEKQTSSLSSEEN